MFGNTNNTKYAIESNDIGEICDEHGLVPYLQMLYSLQLVSHVLLFIRCECRFLFVAGCMRQRKNAMVVATYDHMQYGKYSKRILHSKYATTSME